MSATFRAVEKNISGLRQDLRSELKWKIPLLGLVGLVGLDVMRLRRKNE
jgi:hypothetical protein